MLYPSSRSSLCIIYILINLKHNPCTNMGKISKVMPLPKSISPGKGRAALRQKVQIFRLKNMIRLNRTYYSLLNFTSKIFQHLVFWAKFKQIKQNLLNSLIYSANCAKFAPIINLFVLCFRHLPRQRTLRNSSELCKFHAIHPAVCELREIRTFC